MKTNKIFAGLVFAALAFAGVACQPEQGVPYEPAEQVSGPQVFFPNTVASKVTLESSATSFDIPIARSNAAEALDVALAASGAGVECGAFTVPSSVSFAAGSESATITVGVNPDNMEVNVFLALSIAISEDVATPYGAASVSLTAGVSLPWIKFDTGELTETWWGEVEPVKTMEYQQILPNIRYCRIKDCWGYETIKGGENYPVQDYVFYWNTDNDHVYVPAIYMGFDSSIGPVYAMDECSFYNEYSNYGYVYGTQEYFEYCESWREKYPEDYYPYYDGNGAFYLADFYMIKASGVFTGQGYTYDGADIDTFIGKSFTRADYTIEISYGGMQIAADNTTISYVVNASAAKDVASVICGASSTDSPEDILAALQAGEPLASADVVAGNATLILSGLEPGKYNVVVVPVNAAGEAQYKSAVAAKYNFPGLGTPAEEEPYDITGEWLSYFAYNGKGYLWSPSLTMTEVELWNDDYQDWNVDIENLFTAWDEEGSFEVSDYALPAFYDEDEAKLRIATMYDVAEYTVAEDDEFEGFNPGDKLGAMVFCTRTQDDYVVFDVDEEYGLSEETMGDFQVVLYSGSSLIAYFPAKVQGTFFERPEPASAPAKSMGVNMSLGKPVAFDQPIHFERKVAAKTKASVVKVSKSVKDFELKSVSVK